VTRRPLAAALLLAAACAACSGGPAKPPPPPFRHLQVASAFHTYHLPNGPGLVTSIAQDDAGEVIVADGGHVYALGRAGSSYTFTELVPPVGLQPWRPDGLAFRDGLLYVANGAGHDVIVLRPAATTLGLVRRIALPGTMVRPENVAVDSDGSVVVADSDAKLLLRFSAAGVLQWRLPLDRPRGVAIAGGNVYATASGNGTIVEVNPSSGGLVRKAGAPGVSSGRYQLPVGLSVGPGGRLLVTDAYNGRITTLDQQLRVVNEVGANGGGMDAFNLPFATLATAGGYVIADTYKDRLVETDARFVEQDQVVFAHQVPTGRGRPLVYGTDARPSTFAMLPGVDAVADLGLRQALPFVGGFNGLDQAGSPKKPIHLTISDTKLGTMGQTWAQRVGGYDVVGSPTNARLEVIDPTTGMFTYVLVGGDAWWRADGALILPGGLRVSLVDAIRPASAAFQKASQLLAQGASRQDVFNRVLGDTQPRNWAADLTSDPAKQFLSSGRTRDDARRYFDAVLRGQSVSMVELLAVKYLSGS